MTEKTLVFWSDEDQLEENQCLTCPSSGTLALELVEGQQGADALIGTGVVGVTRGVLWSLAVLPREAERADAGGSAWYRYTS